MEFPNGFNRSKAIACANLCNEAYRMHTLRWFWRFLKPSNLKILGSFKAKAFTGKRELFGFVAKQNGILHVVFRGTVTPAEWQANAIMTQTDFGFVQGAGKVHTGSLKIYASFRERIFKLLPASETRLVITGHSLGAGLASLLALDVAKHKDFAALEVYTFGEPRVGDPAFVKSYEQAVSESFRVVNASDPITKIPLEQMGSFEFRHVPKECTIFYPHGNGHDIENYLGGLEKAL